VILREEIRTIVEKSLEMAIAQEKLPRGDYPDVKIEYPREDKFGDYSTPFAMESAKIIKQSPMQTGDVLKEYIETFDIVDEVHVVKPGFINIFIHKNYLYDTVTTVHNERENYGRTVAKNPQSINIEFVSANPTGPMNVVSARAAALGDTLARLYESAGHTVEKEYYVNDFGNQVRLLGESVKARMDEIEGKDTPFPEEGYQGEYVYDIARYILEQYKEDINALTGDELLSYISTKSVEYNVAGQKEDLGEFNVEYTRWFSEKSLHESGAVEETLAFLREKDVLFEEEGKTFFKSTDYGDDKDRVVVRDDGRPTYLLADIAYHRNKVSRKYDKIVNIWGPDHHGYIARLAAAMKIMGYDSDRFSVLIAQQVNLVMEGETVKMSKRLGNFSTMKDLLDEIGRDVARYFFVMRSMESHLDFDLALAKKESSENPVFYLQYAHARICSLFRKGEEEGHTYDSSVSLEAYLSDEESIQVMKLLAKYPEEIEDAASVSEPHRLTTFLMRLAQSFHRFYTEHRIITENSQETSANLSLCDAVRTVLRNGLAILGVSAPERM
jgi:arginyl-tRNA synthetase